jgi:hypothetical protein
MIMTDRFVYLSVTNFTTSMLYVRARILNMGMGYDWTICTYEKSDIPHSHKLSISVAPVEIAFMTSKEVYWPIREREREAP